ncbi:uncharacterized protein THITE_2110409 [Thermothielavioides terrestris NRRL 8126]|uniref:Phytanoyl-CoA dioxygenase family protein n=1 Tax=Thermothielavioides terrestris (strain ATCC 38088 / NRRL 8126) TaxID=578455 RepID=G2QSR3_THETT|nr:uncharacterized protein THITE_2110409 [Thermothielavioides terrestris NRRL 8126]AEO64346.1 hypothetical protein THITE_2110409 [Thermothielavioides terrestris NRRL 8126]
MTAETTTTTPSPSPDPHPHLTALRRDGFVIVRSLLTPAELADLRAAAGRLTAAARAGAWPYVRTVGKQFPPWDGSLVPSRAGIWGVQHLLHPDLPVQEEGDRGVFVRAYFHAGVLRVARELLSLSDAEGEGEGEGGDGDGEGDDGDGLTMELFNMLVRPDGGRGFALRWHRDDIPATATAEEEAARLKKPGEPYVHTQWNLPLYDDDSLIVVPGSHARPRTDAERAADPYADPLEGQVTVRLNAGDCVFYDNNILHRGVYDAEKERMTLHGSVGHVNGSRERARNVLQHGVAEWVDRCDFSVLGEGKKRRMAEAMRRRLIELGRENQGRDVGYSLEG